jgi:hypothetical protein
MMMEHVWEDMVDVWVFPLTLYRCLCACGGHKAHGAHHEILKDSIRSLGILAHVLFKARYLGCG